MAMILAKLFLFASLMVMVIANPDLDDPRKEIAVAIQGVVICQNCSHGTGHSLGNSKPIEDATVAIVCEDDFDRIMYYKTEKTSSNGYFYHIILDNEGLIFDPEVYDPVDYCEVRLVASPMKNCATFTNINKGISGGALRLERSFHHSNHSKVILYSTGPFAFATPLSTCPYNKTPSKSSPNNKPPSKSSPTPSPPKATYP